jgi:hypothetical protein
MLLTFVGFHLHVLRIWNTGTLTFFFYIDIFYCVYRPFDVRREQLVDVRERNRWHDCFKIILSLIKSLKTLRYNFSEENSIPISHPVCARYIPLHHILLVFITLITSLFKTE